jgi:hypothetical protein
MVINQQGLTMIRNTIFGVAAAAIFAAAGGALVSASLASTTASASHSGYIASNKPAYIKGGIAKNCLDNQGECGLIAR